MNSSIYLDHHNATYVYPESAEVLTYFSTENFFIPTSNSLKGEIYLKKLLKATETIKSSFNNKNKHNLSFDLSLENIILKIAQQSCIDMQDLHFIIPRNETLPFINSSKVITSLGGTCSYIQISPQGLINLEHLEQLLSLENKVTLLSLSSVNGITGVVNPLDKIIEICKQKNTLVHLDITYSLSKTILHTDDFDFISADFHFTHSPKGIYGLLSNTKIKSIRPHHSMIMATAKSIEKNFEMINWMQTQCGIIKNTFEEFIIKHIPQSTIFGNNTIRIPNCSCIIIPNVHSELLSYHLDNENIHVTCGGGEIFQNLSQHLKLSIYQNKNIFCAIAIAIDKSNTKDEIMIAAKKIVTIANNLSKNCP